MSADSKYRSQLFTLHIWTEPGLRHTDASEQATMATGASEQAPMATDAPEQASKKNSEIRLKVQHVLSGEVRYFREWPAFIAFLVSVAKNDEIARTSSE